MPTLGDIIIKLNAIKHIHKQSVRLLTNKLIAKVLLCTARARSSQFIAGQTNKVLDDSLFNLHTEYITLVCISLQIPD